MKIVFRLALGLVLTVLVAAVVAYWWTGRGLQPLNDEARLAAPGKFLTLPEGKLFYRWDGPEQGPVVVMVHGFSISSPVFDHNVPALVAKGYRVLRMDNWGRGWSDRPDIRHDSDLFDRQLLGALDALGVKDKIELIGFSMGGGIATSFATRHPERVNKLVLLAPAGIYFEVPFAVRLASAPVIGQWLMRVFGRKVVLAPPLIGGPNTELEIIAAYDNSAKYPGYLESLSYSLRDYPLRNLEPDFEKVGSLGKPVLLVWGDKDTVVPYALAPRAAKLTKGTLITVKDALHGANMQYPQIFDAAVADFLSH